LDAPRVKAELKTAPGPLLIVVSSDIYTADDPQSPVPDPRISSRLVTAQVADHEYQGWIHLPA
jgi:hypothetical protein